MPEREWDDRIQDIIESIKVIQSYSADLSEHSLLEYPEKVDAILFRFTVIGEAVAHIPETIRTRYTDVPWQEMRDMRNFIAHVYWGIDIGIVWNTIVCDLPPLVLLLEKIIEESEK